MLFEFHIMSNFSFRGAKYDGGTTNTADGLLYAYQQQFTSNNGDRQNVQNIIIIITDGRSNVNPERTIPNAQAAKDRGITIYA